jgi:1-acyl-sn-glycerol-3-phosphate acyltransferase
MASGSVGATAFAVLRTFSVSAQALADAVVGRLTVARADDHLRLWSRRLVERADVDLIVEGIEHAPRDRACVYMSNHQSHYDIPILFSVIPGSLRMVAKQELFRIPVFGRALRQAGFVCVDRSGDRQKAEAAMREAADAIARGISVWMAPEGTRSLDGRLGKLKKGGFLLAQQTRAEIVPIAIDGSRAIIPKHTTLVRRGVPVRIVFGRPISVAGKDLSELMGVVRGFFAANVTAPQD